MRVLSGAVSIGKYRCLAMSSRFMTSSASLPIHTHWQSSATLLCTKLYKSQAPVEARRNSVTRCNMTPCILCTHQNHRTIVVDKRSWWHLWTISLRSRGQAYADLENTKRLCYRGPDGSCNAEMAYTQQMTHTAEADVVLTTHQTVERLNKLWVLNWIRACQASVCSVT